MLVRVDGLAQRYGGRPCQFLGVDPLAEPWLALWVDEASALAGYLSSQREPALPAQAPPAPPRRNRVVMVGGAPVVTGVIERE